MARLKNQTSFQPTSHNASDKIFTIRTDKTSLEMECTIKFVAKGKCFSCSPMHFYSYS